MRREQSYEKIHAHNDAQTTDQNRKVISQYRIKMKQYRIELKQYRTETNKDRIQIKLLNIYWLTKETLHPKFVMFK